MHVIDESYGSLYFNSSIPSLCLESFTKMFPFNTVVLCALAFSRNQQAFSLVQVVVLLIDPQKGNTQPQKPKQPLSIRSCQKTQNKLHETVTSSWRPCVWAIASTKFLPNDLLPFPWTYSNGFWMPWNAILSIDPLIAASVCLVLHKYFFGGLLLLYLTFSSLSDFYILPPSTQVI